VNAALVWRRTRYVELDPWFWLALAATLIILTALVSVGLTAPADGLFTIGIRPVFFRIDPAAIAESRASALGLDIDIRLWTLHLHFAWSAIPLTPASTKSTGSLL
jgi:hypothetical protein